MRILILGIVVGIAAMHHETLIEHADRLLLRGDSPEVVAALELRCGGAEDLERRHCEADLRDAFERGTSDAGTIVKLHCTHFENRWSGERDDSPICRSLGKS